MKNNKKKIRSFKEIYNHNAVMYVDTNDYNQTKHYNKYDRCPILIGLKEDYRCIFTGCGIVSALSKQDAIYMVNAIEEIK